MFSGKIYIRSCSDPVLNIRNKVPAVVAFSMFLLDVFLVIVELMLDIGFVIVIEGTEGFGTETLEIVRCFVMCVDLPKRRNRIIFYFKFLFSKGTNLCGF